MKPRSSPWALIVATDALPSGIAAGWLTCDPALSPDGKLLAYASDRGGKGVLDIWVQPATRNPPSQRVAPTAGKWPIPKSEWIDVTDGTQWDDKPRWSPDGGLLYFTSERDGYRCLWAQRLDPHTHRNVGAAFAVRHFHSGRRSMLNVGLSPLEVAVRPDRIVFVLGELTGNVRLTHLP